MTAKSLTHKFASAIADGTDATLVRPVSNWNDDHNLWLGNRTVTTTSDTITNADHFSVIKYNTAAACAVALAAPASGNMPLGWTVKLKNSGTAQATVTIGGGTINGQPSLMVDVGESLEIDSDGSSDYVGILSLATTSAVFGSNSYMQTGLTGRNNTTTPASQMDFAVTEITLRNSAGQTVRTVNGSATCNILTAGPAANGRDQAGAFSANSWIHFYWIYNRTTSTLATIASTADPTTGPTLPSGYTYWAYICPVRYEATPVLFLVLLRDSWVFYQNIQASGLTVLSNGSATSDTAIACGAVVPPNAVTFRFDYFFYTGTASTNNTLYTASLGPIAGGPYTYKFQAYGVGTVTVGQSGQVDIPNINQNAYYLNSTINTALTLQVCGYSVANGAT